MMIGGDGTGRHGGGVGVRDGGAMDLGMPTVYEAVTRRMVESMAEELREIKTRVNGLLFMVAGAILVDLAVRLAG